jgi:hypothetical protein
MTTIGDGIFNQSEEKEFIINKLFFGIEERRAKV